MLLARAKAADEEIHPHQAVPPLVDAKGDDAALAAAAAIRKTTNQGFMWGLLYGYSLYSPRSSAISFA